MLKTRLLCLALAASLLVTPGCLIGSPVAAFSGEPYGMTVDDWMALGGRKGRIWSDAPVFAAVDLPFAFVLDTAFLPISLIMWGLTSAADPSEDDYDDEEDAAHDEDHEHEHEDGTHHSHGDGEPHEH